MAFSQVTALAWAVLSPQSPVFPRVRTGSLPFCTSHPHARAQKGESAGLLPSSRAAAELHAGACLMRPARRGGPADRACRGHRHRHHERRSEGRERVRHAGALPAGRPQARGDLPEQVKGRTTRRWADNRLSESTAEPASPTGGADNTPRRLHSARNACHSSLSVRPALRFGVSCSLRSAGPQLAALGRLTFQNGRGHRLVDPAGDRPGQNPRSAGVGIASTWMSAQPSRSG